MTPAPARYPGAHYWLQMPAPDWREVEAEGRARQQIVEVGAVGSSFRMDDRDRAAENVVGTVGEWAFADYFGLPRPPFRLFGAGDDGYEFDTPAGLIDVKSAKAVPWFMPVRESAIRKAKAARFALIYTPLRAPFTYLVGWCAFAVAAAQPRVPNCYEPNNPRPRKSVPGRVVHVRLLEDPQTLAALIACGTP